MLNTQSNDLLRGLNAKFLAEVCELCGGKGGRVVDRIEANKLNFNVNYRQSPVLIFILSLYQ